MVGKANDLVLFLMNADREKLFELKEHREKRSLNQNSYYWALIGKLSQKTKIPSSEIHNRNLRDLGLVLRINDRLVPVYLPDTDEAEKQALSADTYHLKPTSSVKAGRDGINYRCYVMLRGSSTFNTEEMGALLDLLIQDAKAQGIETMTPDELERMREAERIAQSNKSNRNKPKG